MSNKPYKNDLEISYQPPVVMDPETGHIETIGEGRVAVMGEEGVRRVVSLPKSNDMIDMLVADGRLSHGA